MWIDESIPSHNRPEERVLSIASLSSTGSADMYSVTEDSDEEEASELGPSILSKATLKTIELIMRKIEVNLGYAAYIQCAGGQTSRGHSGTGEPSRNAGRGTGQGGAGGKRKSRTDESTPSSNPDDDGPTKRRRVSIATTEDSETGPRFACPFYKHDPNRYRNRRTCPGPGWPTVHRMKEHLYRAHAKPILCPRCYTMFDSDNELAVHLRSNPCLISAPQPIDGIDRETLMGLRKRSPALRLEEDKWRDAYRLLFPDVEGADIPSPCKSKPLPNVLYMCKNTCRALTDVVFVCRLRQQLSHRRIPPLPPRTPRAHPPRTICNRGAGNRACRTESAQAGCGYHSKMRKRALILLVSGPSIYTLPLPTRPTSNDSTTNTITLHFQSPPLTAINTTPTPSPCSTRNIDFWTPKRQYTNHRDRALAILPRASPRRSKHVIHMGRTSPDAVERVDRLERRVPAGAGDAGAGTRTGAAYYASDASVDLTRFLPTA